MKIFIMAVKVASVCIYVCEYMYIYIYVYIYVCVYMFMRVCIYTHYTYTNVCIDASCVERWGAGVETQKNVRGEIGGWGRVPFNEPYAPSLSTIYDGA